MNPKLIVTGNTHPADTAASKSEPFYKLTSSELKQFYRAKLLDAALYILLIVKTHGKAGWRWTFKVKDFCQEWEISKTAFYRAVSKLKTLDLLHWEVGETITVWYGTDIAKNDSFTTKTILLRQNSPHSGTEFPIAGLKTPETITSSSAAEASDSSQSYSEFKKTLSDCQRENFFDFGRRKANQLPKPPELPDKWVAANWEELKSQWEQTKEGSAAITSQTDWTQHPDWEDWLLQMRESVPRFVALGTCFDNKTRRAIADWADERKLIWGAES